MKKKTKKMTRAMKSNKSELPYGKRERHFISGQLNNSLSCLITLKTPAILNNKHNENETENDADADVDVDGSRKI